ncbi:MULTISPECIES: hypothetical protein [Microbacterium]|jgi:hypothetical protein|uniref:hypothetical protein n=1 Tax=Microbacterium TaxID=33882 RepID=UPI000FF0006E|nr:MULTISPECIES: hypothetical protein [Microbacterium]MDF2579262.1 hypothetical protein [Microbacterium sp.]RKE64943.1 hypothetical protein DEU36_2180 [Microbacterium sp. AG238]WJM15482.1 hypothetical protein QUC20_14570 [Microbacterium arborescens]
MTQLDTIDTPHPDRADDRGEVRDIVRGIVIIGVLAFGIWLSLAGVAYAFAQVVLAVTD